MANVKSKKIVSLSLAILVIILNHGVEAASKRKIKRGLKHIGNRPQEQSMMKALSVVKNTFLLALAPVVFMFLYSVITYPATPRIACALWKIVKKKFLGTLSGAKREIPPSLSRSKLNDLEARSPRKYRSTVKRTRPRYQVKYEH